MSTVKATAVVSIPNLGSTTLDAEGTLPEEALARLSWKTENLADNRKYTARIVVTRDGQTGDGLSAKCRNVLQVERDTLFWNGAVEVV